VKAVGFDGTRLLFTTCREGGACGIFQQVGTSQAVALVAPEVGGGKFLSWDATALFFADARAIYKYVR
jgi:hypothetical protein